VLESRHVIGLFLLMLVFSGVFFALGYVMGRNQYDGQVSAGTFNTHPKPRDVAPKPEPAAKRAVSAPESNPPSDIATQPSSEWSFYNSSKSSSPEENLHASPTTGMPKNVSAVARGRNTKSSGGLVTSGGYTLQVAALRKPSDALALASHLQKKNFPAFVISPQGDKYYRVQVGPYADQKSADAAKKGLESAGFKAIVKH
jgi:cell division septation protein DedD